MRQEMVNLMRPRREEALARQPRWLTVLLIIIVVSLVGQIALSVTTAATVGPRLARIEARIEVLER